MTSDLTDLVDPGLLDTHDFDARCNSQATLLPLFRDALRRAGAILKQRFHEGVPPPELVVQRAWLIDQLLIRAWRRIVSTEHDIALVAVGGYGRGELHPCSDIDIMILLPGALESAFQQPIEDFLTFLWDIGLEVGHSVRTLDECVDQAARDITVATNLMEARLLCGPADLFRIMTERTGPQALWPSRDFFAAKLDEQIARHARFNDTAYNLEPNIKEGPGGLRDIQMIGWVAKRHFGADTLHDLVEHGFLTENEYRQLLQGQTFLWRIRIALHTLNGRREDRLLFDYQRTLAQLFGYPDAGHHLAVEQFMKEYYRTVMELGRLNEMLLQLLQEEILFADEPGTITPINARFQAQKGFIEIAHSNIFRRYPFALLEIFLILQQNPAIKGVRANTIRAIRDHRYLINEQFRADLRCTSLFMEILRQSQGISRELRHMNRYGVLAAYIPAFSRIVGQMQHDLFHVYTVDEHTLFVVRNLRRFSVVELAHEFPTCSAVFQRLEKPELVYLAALFHDIAKGRGGDHSELGAADAEDFCRQHGLGLHDTHLVSWLVRHHLLMSTTAQRKDLSDPSVINAFAAAVASQARLDYLYLLTVADIRATSPTLWNGWKGALLVELYNATRRALSRGLENPLETKERIRHLQEMALRVLAQQGMPDQRISALWQRLNEDYFLRHSADEIAWHTQAILQTGAEELPLILIRQQTQRGGTEIFIYTGDHDYLFAQCTAALEQLDLTVMDARIITSRDGYALDTFIVLETSGEPIHSGYRIQEIESYLREKLLQAHPTAETLSRPSVTRGSLPRRLKHFNIPTRVTFQHDEDNQRTVMEITTTDRPGVLARLGLALAQCEIRLQNAKISTFGERVEDVFFITDRHNRPLEQPAQFDCLRGNVIKNLES